MKILKSSIVILLMSVCFQSQAGSLDPYSNPYNTKSDIGSALGFFIGKPLAYNNIDNEEIAEKIRSLQSGEDENVQEEIKDLIKNSKFKVEPKDNTFNWRNVFVRTNENSEIIEVSANKISRGDMQCSKEAKDISNSLSKDYGMRLKSSFSYMQPYYSYRELNNGTIEVSCDKNIEENPRLLISIIYKLK